MILFLQMPEPDGGIPFAWFQPTPEHVLVLAGVAGGLNGGEGLEGGLLTPNEQGGLERELLQQGFIAVDFEKGIQILRQIMALNIPVPEEWLYMQQHLPTDIQLRSYEEQIGEGDVDIASRVAPILDPNLGFFIQIPERILEDGMKGIRVAFLNEHTIQRNIIDAAVDACADIFWDEANQARWRMSWAAAELVAEARQYEPIAESIRHNRWLAGEKGRHIPIVRTWVDRQLAQLTAITTLMAKHRKQAD